MLLVGRLGAKLTSVNWKDIRMSSVKEHFFILSRLVKSYATGKYKAIPWKAMITVLAAVLYFLNPLDLIPDFIPGVGLTDDVGVVLWVFTTLKAEIDKFLEWEKQTIQTL